MAGFGISQRRACDLVKANRGTCRYRPVEDDAGLVGRLTELAVERRRFGYRRLHWMLRREGFRINHKKVYRLYREHGLTVRKRGGRKRSLGTRSPVMSPTGVNQRWSLRLCSRRSRWPPVSGIEHRGRFHAGMPGGGG